MKQETNPFPKTKLQWLWENMNGCRGIYFVGMAGTVVYNHFTADRAVLFRKDRRSFPHRRKRRET